LVDLLVGVAGSVLGASGALTVVAGGSLAVGAAGTLCGTGVTGASVTGCVTSGAAWAIKAVEERARTAAIADIAGRILALLWVMSRQRTANHYGCAIVVISVFQRPAVPFRRSSLK
jgi:hypothetical protein